MSLLQTFRVHHASQLPGPLRCTRPVLYTHTLCPYAQRVWLTLLQKVGQAGSFVGRKLHGPVA